MADPNPWSVTSTGGGSSNPWSVTSGSSAPAKKSGGGILSAVAKYSGADLVGNLGKDVGSLAAGIGPGIYKTLKDAGQFEIDTASHPLRPKTAQNQPLLADLSSIGKQSKDYYGHDLLHHLYKHPLQPILDVATVVTGGAGAAAKAGKLAEATGVVSDTSRVAKLGGLTDRVPLETRSPRKVATGKGPSHVDVGSTSPITKAGQVVAHAARRARPDGAVTVGGKTFTVGGEAKRYGAHIQANANRAALDRMTPLAKYQRAIRGLKPNEWTALHIRAMDIHPSDLTALWKGTPLESTIANPDVRRLALEPSKRMLRAEPAARALSKEGEALFRSQGRLKDKTAAARPGLTKQQASETLGRQVKPITNDPYYFPHTREPQPNVSPLVASGGGKGVPRKLGSMKQNEGVLALRGKLHLRSDVIGPEFLRRVKFVKYDEIHNALVRGAVRVTKEQIDHEYGGRLPQGYEYIRTKPGQKIPATIRGEGDKHIPLDKLIPNPETLHNSPLTEGFSTTDAAQAHVSGGRYYIVPKSTVSAATGEFTKSSEFTNAFVKKPLAVWRAAVLGLRVGFLTNNLIGNSVMYGVRTGGKGALRDLFGAILEHHGRDTGLKLLRSQATPPELRADLMKEFFPEQVHGTFGRTQTPATSTAHLAGRKTVEGLRAATGAIPKLTSKVAEEYPRRALVRHLIRNSPEFKAVYKTLPKQTRTFEMAARRVLEGKGGAQFQRHVSNQVNRALGDYLNLSPFERNVMRNLLPFYSWYRAIVTTTGHLAVDTPLRANILGQIGRIGKEQSDQWLGQVPSFLEGSIGLGAGANGTKRVLTTQGLNPYSTLSQIETGDVSNLGLNPFVQALLQGYAQEAATQHTPYPHVNTASLVAGALKSIVTTLPPARLISPTPPSKLYPNRNRNSEILSFLGAPVKEYNPVVAALQAQNGR